MSANRIVYIATLGELAEVPGTPFSYWAPKSVRELFDKFPPLDRDVAGEPDEPKIADVKVGLQTSDDLRFTRYWWEVPVGQIAATREHTLQDKKWVPFSVGQWLDKFRMDLDTVVNWQNNGEEIRNFPRAFIRNEVFYFREGLAWNASVQMRQLRRLEQGGAIPFYSLPAGTIFSIAHQAIFCDLAHKWALLGSICSAVHLSCSRLFTLYKMGTGIIAKLPIAQRALTESPMAPLSREAHDLLCEWDTGNEVSTQFIRPWILQVWDAISGAWNEATARPVTAHPLADDFEWSDWQSAKGIRSMVPPEAPTNRVGLRALAEACVGRERLLRLRLAQIQRQVDDEVYQLYGITAEDRAVIETELVQPSQEDSGAEPERPKDENHPLPAEVMPANEHIKRLVHHLAHQVIKDDADGIVPLHDTYKAEGLLERGLSHRVRDRLRELFGGAALPSAEEDMRLAFGSALDDWVESKFFSDHIGLYRWRPIIWQIASRSKGRPAFGCFVYWHKLDADTLRKVQEVYLRPAVESARMDAERLATQLSKQQAAGETLRTLRQIEKRWRDAEKRHDELRSLGERIQGLLQPHKLAVQSRSAWVPGKVNEIVAQGYGPNRDYGVRVNIEPLKQAEILAASANRVKG